MVQNRIVVNSMETRNAIGIYDKAGDSYTSLFRHPRRRWLARPHRADRAAWRPSKLRVITTDVGGGFGMKGRSIPNRAWC